MSAGACRPALVFGCTIEGVTRETDWPRRRCRIVNGRCTKYRLPGVKPDRCQSYQSVTYESAPPNRSWEEQVEVRRSAHCAGSGQLRSPEGRHHLLGEALQLLQRDLLGHTDGQADGDAIERGV